MCKTLEELSSKVKELKAEIRSLEKELNTLRTVQCAGCRARLAISPTTRSAPPVLHSILSSSGHREFTFSGRHWLSLFRPPRGVHFWLCRPVLTPRDTFTCTPWVGLPGLIVRCHPRCSLTSGVSYISKSPGVYTRDGTKLTPGVTGTNVISRYTVQFN